MFRFARRVLLFLSAATLSEQFTQLGAYGVTPNKVITALLLGICILKPFLEPRRMPHSSKNLWMIALGVAGVTSLSMSFLMGFPADVLALRGTTLYAIIVYYFVLIYAVEDRRDLGILFWGIVLGTAAIAITGTLGLGRVEEGSRWTRSGGLGGNPNLLAMNCAITNSRR